MRTVTPAFLVTQEKEQNSPVVAVYYKRRYWDSGSSAYVYEANWTKLTADQIESVDPIVQNLDTETLSEFQISNASIRLKNTKNEWKPTNTAGFFAPDLTSALGYEPYLMKFKVETGFGYVGETDQRSGARSGGAEELIAVFTGLANSWQFDSESGVVVVDVQGAERLLQNADATRVCNTATDESLGTGDGSNKDFSTSNNGVSRILEVSVDGVTLKAGIDFDVAGIGELDEGAKITFSEPPANGDAVLCSYEYWDRNQLLEDVIEGLVDEAGITSKSIASATLGSIQNNITQSSYAEFSLGSNTNADLEIERGSIIPDLIADANKDLQDDFSEADLETAGWTRCGTSQRKNLLNQIVGMDCTLDITSGEFRNGYGSASGQTNAVKKVYANPIGYGVWQIKVRATGTAYNDPGLIWWFMTDRDPPATWEEYLLQNQGKATMKGYQIAFVEGAITFYAMDGGSILASYSCGTYGSTQITLTVKRNSKGRFYIYNDSTLVASFTETTYDKMDRMVCINTVATTPTSYYLYVDDIYIPTAGTITLTHESQSIDTLGGITAWGNLTVDFVKLDADVVTVQTNVSSDNSNWDGWVSLSGNAIQSNVKRYIKVKITLAITPASFDVENPARILGYTIQFTSSSIIIALAVFDGMSCYDALQEYCKLIPTFEWGLDANEQFFYRQRNSSTSVDVAFTQSKNLAKISYLEYDYQNMYSVVRATYGNFISEVEDTAGSASSMLEIIGRKVFDIGTGVLLNKDTNIAGAIATYYLARLKKKRRRVRMQTKFYPQIELSDTVSVTYKRDAFSSEEQFLDTLVCNVIGVKHDWGSATSEFELEEIL